MPFKSSKKRKAYGKAWQKLNKSKQKQYNKKWKDKLKDWYLNYKSAAKCAVCGEERGVVLESHHVHREDKSFCVFEGLKRGISIRRLEIEASKCIVVCNRCHRLHHYNAFTPEEQRLFNIRIKKFEEENGTHDFGQPKPTIKSTKKPKKKAKKKSEEVEELSFLYSEEEKS